MKSLVLAVCVILVSACDSSSGPNGSWKVGKDNSAVYVFIEENDSTDDRIYKGRVYSVVDESVIFEGNFDYSRHTPIDYSNSEIYMNWDGERLYLNDNSFLKAVR